MDPEISKINPTEQLNIIYDEELNKVIIEHYTSNIFHSYQIDEEKYSMLDVSLYK